MNSLDLSPRAFRHRWKAQRIEAILPFIHHHQAIACARDTEDSEGQLLCEDEWLLLTRVQERDYPSLLSAVRRMSKNLGSQLQPHNASTSLQACLKLLEASETPCTHGTWKENDQQFLSLNRAPCQHKGQALWCDYWEEAIDGFLEGFMGGSPEKHLSFHHQEGSPSNSSCRNILMPLEPCPGCSS